MHLTSGMIHVAWHVFENEWKDAGSTWRDAVARSFDKRHVGKIQIGVMALAAASHDLENEAAGAERELSDAESML